MTNAAEARSPGGIGRLFGAAISYWFGTIAACEAAISVCSGRSVFAPMAPAGIYVFA